MGRESEESHRTDDRRTHIFCGLSSSSPEVWGYATDNSEIVTNNTRWPLKTIEEASITMEQARSVLFPLPCGETLKLDKQGNIFYRGMLVSTDTVDKLIEARKQLLSS